MQKTIFISILFLSITLYSQNNFNVYIDHKNKIEFLEIKKDSADFIRFTPSGDYYGSNLDFNNFHLARNAATGKLQIDDAMVNGVRFVFQYSFGNISRVFSNEVSYDFNFWDGILYEIRSGINTFKFYNTVTKRLEVTNGIDGLNVYRVGYSEYKEDK